MMGELIEKLCIANLKLYHLCDKKADIVRNPDGYTKEEVVEVCRRDIELCKMRAKLKTSIDGALFQAIMNKGDLAVIDEVKNYGTN